MGVNLFSEACLFFGSVCFIYAATTPWFNRYF